jgi:hypothetical protein
MIKSINSSSSKWVNVQSSEGGGSIYVDSAKFQQGIAGQVRYTGNYFEVNDGMGWRTLYDSHAMVSLTEPAQQALQWALKQCEKEQELEKLAESNVTVKDAVDSYKKTIAEAEEKLKVVITLAKETA